ncbi:hypothetical protein CVV70_02755 [Ralstonia solanacearum]|nr:hypothetical protein CCY86_07605 [Ralstonia solanacearum]KEI33534.1 hypothetical protein CQ06_09555 [Ralstonia solanacearum]NUU69368.1 hypothetical protein [Ralstonia solanacearum]OCQ58549.1 hypothetical protein AR463_06500 [Ralstonia solanacearum]OCQ65221.1 hypothetical protein AR464_12495 [Ralstonia solanacearum]
MPTLLVRRHGPALKQPVVHVPRVIDPLGIESRRALALPLAVQFASSASIDLARQVGDDVLDFLNWAGVIGLPSRAPIASIRRSCAFERRIQARCAEGLANLLH